MKLFNVDIHISIIHDIKTLFKEMGHQVDSWCMSGHTWVNGEERIETEIVNSRNFLNIDQSMCDKFYEEYKNLLDDYDGFIHSYPPAFSALFEKWDKPIYTIACTRYEFPCGSGPYANTDRLKWLNDKLISGNKNGQIKFIANNLYDKKYCETYCGGEWKHIPSICKYVEHVTCSGINNKIIIWDRNRDGLRETFYNPKIYHQFNISQVYDRYKLNEYCGIIHLPYNISIMSAFEHYAMGIPMFVPSYELLTRWKKEGRDVLGELEFPNNLNHNLQDEWIRLADWYDEENMPHVIFFDSIEQLHQKINIFDRAETTSNMKNFYFKKKNKIKKMWTEALEC